MFNYLIGFFTHLTTIFFFCLYNNQDDQELVMLQYEL